MLNLLIAAQWINSYTELLILYIYLTDAAKTCSFENSDQMCFLADKTTDSLNWKRHRVKYFQHDFYV